MEFKLNKNKDGIVCFQDFEVLSISDWKEYKDSTSGPLSKSVYYRSMIVKPIIDGLVYNSNYPVEIALNEKHDESRVEIRSGEKYKIGFGVRTNSTDRGFYSSFNIFYVKEI